MVIQHIALILILTFTTCLYGQIKTTSRTLNLFMFLLFSTVFEARAASSCSPRRKPHVYRHSVDCVGPSDWPREHLHLTCVLLCPLEVYQVGHQTSLHIHSSQPVWRSETTTVWPLRSSDSSICQSVFSNWCKVHSLEFKTQLEIKLLKKNNLWVFVSCLFVFFNL